MGLKCVTLWLEAEGLNQYAAVCPHRRYGRRKTKRRKRGSGMR
jgi:hypothetical protein